MASLFSRLAILVVPVLVCQCSLLVDASGLSGGQPADAAAVTDAGDADPREASTDAPSASGISFVTASGAGARNASSLTITLPEAPQQGDLVLAVVYDANGQRDETAMHGAGWTVVSHVYGYYWVLYTFASASTEPSFTFDFGTGNAAGAAIAVYRGVDAAVPLDQSSFSPSCQDSANYSRPDCEVGSVTTSREDEMLVLLCAVDGTAPIPAWTMPNGMTKRVDQGRVAIADEQRPAAGPTGPRVATHTVTGWSSFVASLALRPAH